MPSIILASKSPRRKELMTLMGLEFSVVGSDFDEELDDSRSPEQVACELAYGKALAVAKNHPSSIVIGADEIVAVDGEQLEKPVDDDDAKRMLKKLSGRKHNVINGVAVICLDEKIEVIRSAITKVCFKPYNEAVIEAYVATGDSMDKAGSYGIQSGAASLIEYIEGGYDNVVGLPTALVSEMLAEFGIKSKLAYIDCPVPQH
jgi:septum formation protein